MKIGSRPTADSKTVAPAIAPETLDRSSIAPAQSHIDDAPHGDGHDSPDPARARTVPSGVTSTGATTTHSHHGVLGARLAALGGKAIDHTHAHPGQAALARRFDEIERMVKDGVKVRCVFDLDNTLFDTRARTLACAKMFDADNGTSFFAQLALDDVKLDGRETAIAAGLPNDVIEAFGKMWDEAFWDPDNLVHDVVMRPVVEIAQEAQRRGADVVFLTGRVERYVDKAGTEKGFRAATMAQLVRAGLQTDDKAIVLKPGVDVRTAPFKEQHLRNWVAEGAVGFFLTEGRRDIEHVSTTMTSLNCFLLDSSLEEGGPACPGVPVLPRVY